MLNNLIVTLKNEMELKSISQQFISIQTDINVSTISRVLKGTNRELSPYDFSRIVQIVKPSVKTTFVKEYLLKINKPSNICQGLELASNNRFFDEMRHLIEEGHKDRNVMVNEFAKYYEYLYKWQNCNIQPTDLYEAVRFEKGNFPETKILLRLMEMYALYAQEEYSFLLASAGNLQAAIDQLEDEYFKLVFSAKLSEMLMISNLYVLNKPKTARKYAKSVLNAPVGLGFKVAAYDTVADSYLFEDYDKLMKYYKKARQYYAKLKRVDGVDSVDSNIEFAKVMWDKVDSAEFHFTNKLAHALYLSKNNQKEQAKLVLSDADKEDRVYKYVYGCVYTHKQSLWDSLITFVKTGDKFYANMPKLELLKLGEDPFLIKSISEI